MSCKVPFAAMAGLFLLLSGPAAGDDKIKIKTTYHGPAIDARQHGYEHGYREGFHRGAEDRDRRHAYDFNTGDYKHAESGYDKSFGDKGDYKNGYRDGYRAGYDDSFYGRSGRFSDIYGPFDERRRGSADRYDDIYVERGFGAVDVASDIGYRDGLSAGVSDAREGRAFRPEDRVDYRDADHGYRDRYGDKDLYRRHYRDGYSQGYRDGFGRMR